MPHARFVAATFALLTVSSAHAAEPWEAPFAGDPGAIARAAAGMPQAGDPGVTILLDEDRLTFEADGRATETYRQVWRIEKQSAVDDWSEWGVSWAPWHQDRPTLRARVITADGKSHELSQ